MSRLIDADPVLRHLDRRLAESDGFSPIVDATLTAVRCYIEDAPEEDAIATDKVIDILLELFGGDEPCNFCDNDEYMCCDKRAYCEENCGKPTTTAKDCWRAFIMYKLNDARKSDS